jgi:glycine/D-amino acid oxidase-like deaminating enzyme
MYTMTPDAHFIIDHHPHNQNVVIACGFSGHGFKFAPVVGEILADLALDGRTRHDIALFAASRFVRV